MFYETLEEEKEKRMLSSLLKISLSSKKKKKEGKKERKKKKKKRKPEINLYPRRDALTRNRCTFDANKNSKTKQKRYSTKENENIIVSLFVRKH